ncbi:MAG: bifunctional precorrin-2 dehydrogenase/sirohydrochlorin ferrochelatase [Chitinivibrionales bacterium]|nr:bifunctional precorrin-2 dehydrogenase/sirohydrochlorin ferrochelatase [Chitinivibrionales bacterium]
MLHYSNTPSPQLFSCAMYPIYLKLTEKPCLVVGGGTVAERKIASLIEEGARITVIAPEVTPSIVARAKEKKIETLHKRRYNKGEAKDYFLIIAATGDAETNKVVSMDAHEAERLVNVVDVPDLCSFYVPARVTKGNLSIAISTAGSFPGMAKKIRKELEPLFPDTYAPLLEVLNNFRCELKKREPSSKKRMDIYRRIGESSELQEYLKGNTQPLERLLAQCRYY